MLVCFVQWQYNTIIFSLSLCGCSIWWSVSVATCHCFVQCTIRFFSLSLYGGQFHYNHAFTVSCGNTIRLIFSLSLVWLLNMVVSFTTTMLATCQFRSVAMIDLFSESCVVAHWWSAYNHASHMSLFRSVAIQYD